MAFRPGIVGMDGTNNHHNNQDSDTREVSIAAITLPENFHDFDLIDLNIDYIDDPSRFQIHQARAEEITLKEDFISVPMPLDDDFGDANGLDEPEFFRKFQPSLHYNAQNSNMELDSTNIRKEQSIARPFGDDPFALDGFGDFAAPASVIGIGGDNSNLSNPKDHYDHVMSPFHEGDNDPALPTLDDHEAPAGDQNEGNSKTNFIQTINFLLAAENNRMDVDDTNQGLQHIPGADDTTLLSNTLTTLNLVDNQIGYVGAQYLADALKNNTTLTKLNLELNEIGTVGAQHLGDALRNNKTLTELNLGHNQTGAAGAQHLGDALRNNTTLTKLNLEWNPTRDVGA
ncbi:unnamed protein product [Adineta steineri]|uniref:Uncharacterized protein n=1 Tax=Adineta steineri TaxID=433720 RepID=A0A815JZ47_9BILA|nr:unnamed protein product [Adineta steineri]